MQHFTSSKTANVLVTNTGNSEFLVWPHGHETATGPVEGRISTDDLCCIAGSEYRGYVSFPFLLLYLLQCRAVL